jgi:hypothetical protein
MNWIIGIIVIGLARYGMDAVGWSDRAQVLIIVAGIVLAALVIAGVRANRDASTAQGQSQDSA